MRVENTTEHDIMINGKNDDGSITTVNVPAAVGTGASKVNGVREVDEKWLTDLRSKDPVVKGWFDAGDLVSGGGAKRVTVNDNPERTAADVDAAARGPKGHGK